MKKWGIGLLAAAMLLMPGKAEAAQSAGTLHVDIQVEDMAVTRGAVTLYRVGFPVREGYRILEEYGGGIVQQKDALSPHLAAWLAQNAPGEGITRLLDADGDACFTDLEDGLYLGIQTEWIDGFYPIPPFLAAMPDQETWTVEKTMIPEPILVENPQTGDGIGLYVLMLSLSGGVLLGMGKPRVFWEE